MKIGRAATGLAAVVGLGWALADLGDPSLSIPWNSSGDLLWWLDETPPPVMAAALVRLAALVTCGYLGLVLGVALVAELAGWRGLAGVALRATPATLRRLLIGSTHLGLMAGVLLGSATTARATPASAADTPPAGLVPTSAPVVMTLLEPSRAVPSTTAMVELGPPATTPANPPPPAPVPTPPAGPVADDTTWVVRDGDSFWSIAEAVLLDHAEPAEPTERAIGRYWHQLIAANRSRLAAPDHPDLLLPGQSLTIPVPEGR
jgi:hypothetical protein